MVSDQWSRAPASSRSPGLASGDHAHSFAEGARAVPFTDLAAMPMPSRLVGAGSLTPAGVFAAAATGNSYPALSVGSGHPPASSQTPPPPYHAAPQDQLLLLLLQSCRWHRHRHSSVVMIRSISSAYHALGYFLCSKL